MREEKEKREVGRRKRGSVSGAQGVQKVKGEKGHEKGGSKGANRSRVA